MDSVFLNSISMRDVNIFLQFQLKAKFYKLKYPMEWKFCLHLSQTHLFTQITATWTILDVISVSPVLLCQAAFCDFQKTSCSSPANNTLQFQEWTESSAGSAPIQPCQGHWTHTVYGYLTKCLQSAVLRSHRYGWVGVQTCGLVNLWLF